MSYGQELAAAVDADYERTAEDGMRTHLGASVIGGKCQRAIWFSFFWCAVEQAPGRMLRLWERGHREEEVFAECLRRVGAVVWQKDPTTQEQFRVSAFGGHFGGSCDGFVDKLPRLLQMPRLLEMKTHNEKLFQQLKDRGLMIAHPKHYKQAQAYMHLFNEKGWKIAEALYCAVNKNTDELYFEIITYDASFGHMLMDKAEMIIFGDGMPARISEHPGWYECTYCAAKGVCFQTAKALFNCRSCRFSNPERDGSWTCTRGCAEISTAPKQGCALHEYKPGLP